MTRNLGFVRVAADRLLRRQTVRIQDTIRNRQLEALVPSMRPQQVSDES